MTIICWDGKTLAADKRASNNGLIRTTTKIFRVNDCLVGFSGDLDQCMEMVNWVRGGCAISDFPTSQRDKDRWITLGVINQAGLRVYEMTPFPIIYEDAFWATGSGRDYAIAALHLGKTAREAVEISSIFDTGCGNGIDSLELC